MCIRIIFGCHICQTIIHCIRHTSKSYTLWNWSISCCFRATNSTLEYHIHKCPNRNLTDSWKIYFNRDSVRNIRIYMHTHKPTRCTIICSKFAYQTFAWFYRMHRRRKFANHIFNPFILFPSPPLLECGYSHCVFDTM